jgi:hypothetical protein
MTATKVLFHAFKGSQFIDSFWAVNIQDAIRQLFSLYKVSAMDDVVVEMAKTETTTAEETEETTEANHSKPVYSREYIDHMSIWCQGCASITDYECACPDGHTVFPLVTRKEAIQANHSKVI